jgi:hypothetical protein
MLRRELVGAAQKQIGDAPEHLRSPAGRAALEDFFQLGKKRCWHCHVEDRRGRQNNAVSPGVARLTPV